MRSNEIVILTKCPNNRVKIVDYLQGKNRGFFTNDMFFAHTATYPVMLQLPISEHKVSFLSSVGYGTGKV